MNKSLKFHIISMATYGSGLSGGDRIWIELSKILGEKYSVSVYLWEEGLAIAKREGLQKVKFQIWSAKFWARFGFLINYLARIFVAIIGSLGLKLENSSQTIVYSASEFWQDSLPAVILKWRYPKIKWVAAWYQSAPNPLRGFSDGQRASKHFLKAFLYWLVQFPVKPLIKKYVDLVLVNNNEEKKQFLGKKLMVMLGAVDLEKIQLYKSKNSRPGNKYEAVFQGRFHPQKGVVELIDIWKMVVEKKPDAHLALIGDGPLMNEVRRRVSQLGLQKNIKLFGYLFDGPAKYQLFSQSKMVLHPAFFDSGGMAAAEAMAFGIPAIGFDLVSYKSYYPKGMVKVKTGDLMAFAKKIILLLDDSKERAKIGQEGLEMIKSSWSWQSRVENLVKLLN